ncbi:MAG: hypothetical protein DRP56_08990 [Planctomycetota bacterium]|nr:MAG: hypothetical protein DRP56_08990 [Planctomycetota bacterium]RKY13563.1 MAG: hypothetical protein DRP52_02405 [Planctomycetota bacterium]
MIELVGAISGMLAVIGVVFNNYRIRACFIIWLVSNTLSAGLHAQAGMWSLFGRDMIFLGLAFHGWNTWGRKKQQ